MKTHQKLLVGVGVFLLIGCGSAAQNTEPESGASAQDAPMERFEVASSVDENVNFSDYKTYAWAGAVGVVNDPEGEWTAPDMDTAKEVQFLIDRELRALGYTEVVENPDVLVVYSIMVDMEAIDLKDEDNNLAIVDTVSAGALYVALVDTKSEEAVWIGAAVSKIDETPQVETAKERLDFAVTQIMAKLPR